MRSHNLMILIGNGLGVTTSIHRTNMLTFWPHARRENRRNQMVLSLPYMCSGWRRSGRKAGCRRKR